MGREMNKMDCRYHKGIDAKYVCEKCKQPICEQCMLEIKGKYICKECADITLFSKVGESASKKSFFREFIFFCFSLIPGAAQMSMGLFKRGMQLMITIFGVFAILVYFSTEQLIPVICIPIWFFSFFDGYNIKKQKEAGRDIEDREVYDYNLFIKNKRLLGTGLLLLGVLGLANALPSYTITKLFGEGANNVYWVIKRSTIPLFLILLGAYLLAKSRNTDVKN